MQPWPRMETPALPASIWPAPLTPAAGSNTPLLDREGHPKAGAAPWGCLQESAGEGRSVGGLSGEVCVPWF